MTRIEELEKILESVCGNYENDCSKCPRQKECDEFCKLEGIYEIINKQAVAVAPNSPLGHKRPVEMLVLE